jgi:hypothetical protein
VFPYWFDHLREVEDGYLRPAFNKGLGGGVPAPPLVFRMCTLFESRVSKRSVTTFRIRAPIPETEDSAEQVAGELFQLREAGVDLCVLAISPRRVETLSWVAEVVAPRLPL